MRAPAAVLFDLDGTLVDSRPGIVASVYHALETLGHEPDRSEDISYLMGPPISATIGRVLDRYGDKRAEDALVAFHEHQERIGIYDSALFDGVKEMVLELLEMGALLYVATSKREQLARLKLDHFELLTSFSKVYGSVPDGNLDHKPALIAHILGREGLALQRTVMVGDRSFDIAGAQANGVHSIGALWGYGTQEELTSAGADDLAELPSQVPTLVRNYCRALSALK